MIYDVSDNWSVKSNRLRLRGVTSTLAFPNATQPGLPIWACQYSALSNAFRASSTLPPPKSTWVRAKIGLWDEDSAMQTKWCRWNITWIQSWQGALQAHRQAWWATHIARIDC